MQFKYILFFLFLGLVGFTSCSDDTEIGGETDPMENVDDDMDDPDTDVDTDDTDADLDDAPDFSLKTFSDEDLNFAAYEDKLLVIFFFGNRCPPCISVAPDVEERLNTAFKADERFAIIGIDQWDGNAASVENFQERTDVSFPLGVMGSEVAKDYGTTYDRLVIVKPNGKIVFRGSSIVANHLDEAIGVVENLLQ